VSDLENIPAPSWLIDGILADGHGSLYGPSGTGKSFLAIDWAACIATGQPWLGRTSHPGRVVYVAAEGVRGLLKRVRAWETEHGCDVGDRLGFIPQAINLLDADDFHRANRTLTALPDVDLLIVDTFARSMPGGDENSSKDVGLVIARVDQLRAIHGSAALLIHHTGKDKARGERGSSALRGAMDQLLSLDGNHERLRLTCEKQKDDGEFDPIPLHLAPVADSLVVRDGAKAGAGASPAFRPTVLMERISRALEDTPGLTKRAIRGTVAGNNDAKDLGLELLIADRYVRVEVEGQARKHHSIKPFRDTVPTVPAPCPSVPKGTGTETVPPCPPSKGTGHGHGPLDPTTADLWTGQEHGEYTPESPEAVRAPYGSTVIESGSGS
jgi:hypothetical protein